MVLAGGEVEAEPRDGARHMPPIPAGWFVVGRSRALRSRQVLGRRYFGREVVLFRTESGAPALLDAWCPHLGAHFAHGGEVVGEVLRCPFHRFDFDGDGRCVATGYGTRPPPKARARRWPVVEQNGLLLAWHHPDDAPPDWRVPAFAEGGWRPLRFRRWTLDSHPQETTENSVDLGHFAVVHGYRDVEVLRPAWVEGPVLRSAYRITRGRFLGVDIRVAIDVAVHGLGYSVVHTHVENLDMRTRHLVLPTPIERDRVELRVAASLHSIGDLSGLPPALRLLPRALLETVIDWGGFWEYQSDVRDDFRIWANKRHVRRPPLAKGDGPIGLYRRYVRQFYPDGA